MPPNVPPASVLSAVDLAAMRGESTGSRRDGTGVGGLRRGVGPQSRMPPLEYRQRKLNSSRAGIPTDTLIDIRSRKNCKERIWKWLVSTPLRWTFEKVLVSKGVGVMRNASGSCELGIY